MSLFKTIFWIKDIQINEIPNLVQIVGALYEIFQINMKYTPSKLLVRVSEILCHAICHILGRCPI